MKTLLTLLLACIAAPAWAQSVRGPNTTASSPVPTNAFVARVGPSRLHDIVGQVVTNQDVYLMVFDAASTASVTNGATPAVCGQLLFSGLPFSAPWPAGRKFSSGVVVAASSTIPAFTNCGPVLLLDVNYYDAAQ